VDLLETPQLHQDRFNLYRNMLEGSLASAEATFEDLSDVGTPALIENKTAEIKDHIARIDSTLTSLSAAVGLRKLHLLEITLVTSDVWPEASSAVRDALPNTVEVVAPVAIGSTIVLVLAPRERLHEVTVLSAVAGVPITKVEDMGDMDQEQITRSIRGKEPVKGAALESTAGVLPADENEACAKKRRFSETRVRLGC